MATISSGGYYTDYSGDQVDSAVGIALSISNYQTLDNISAGNGSFFYSGAQLPTVAQVNTLLSSGAYVTSGGASTIASAIVSTSLTSYPTSAGVTSMINSAITSVGAIDSAAVSAIVSSAITNSQLQSSAGVNQQISAFVSYGGYTTDVTASAIADSRIVFSNLIDTSTVSAMIIAAGSATSGAIISGKPFSTTVGDYSIAFTSNGGLVVSGDGLSAVFLSGGLITSADDGQNIRNARMALTSTGFVAQVADYVTGDSTWSIAVSGGAIIASGAGSETLIISGGAISVLTSDGGSATIDNTGVSLEDGIGGSASVQAGYLVANGILINGSTAQYHSATIATELVTLIDSTATSAVFAVLSCGTNYIYTQPLTAVSVTSIADDMLGAAMRFTLGSGGTIDLPAAYDVTPTDFIPEDGTTYRVAIYAGGIVIVPCTPGV